MKKSETTSATTSELLARAAKGDRKSFGAFFESHMEEIYRFIFFRVDDHDQAEDLTEKVFLEAWEGITRGERVKKIKNIRAWIYRIAHNKVVDYYRTKKPKVSIEDYPHKNLQTNWLESDVEDMFTSRALARGIRQLPANYKQVIVLRFINQLSHADVAEILKIKEGHARVLQHRALTRLREIVSEG